MEAPRIYDYKWLFTPYRSLDMCLKILLTLFVFLVLLFIAAWYVSRKSYRRAPRDHSFVVLKISDLYRFNLQQIFSRSGVGRHSGAITGQLGSYTSLVVSDWNLIKSFEQSTNLDYYYSAAPGALRRKWYGVLMSDSSLCSRSQLRALLLHAFDTLPNGSYDVIGMLSSSMPGPGKILKDQIISSDTVLKHWICAILAEFLFFNCSGFNDIGADVDESVSHKADFVAQLNSLIQRLEDLHIDGKMSTGRYIRFKSRSAITSELLMAADCLINPLIQHAMARSLDQGNEFSYDRTQIKLRSDSYLNRLVMTYHELNAEGEFVDFIHMAHLIHCLLEVCLILRSVLVRNLRLLFVVLSERPLWQQRLKEEALLTREISSQYTKGSATPAWTSSNLLLQCTDQLTWTKALVNEAMRITATGWPWGSIREATRDGGLGNYEYAQGDLILFNQPAYLHDSAVWNTQTPATVLSEPTSSLNRNFYPWRFLDPGVTDFTKQKLCLPIQWAQFILIGYTVCIPNECIYRLLTAVLLHMWRSGWRVRSIDSANDLNLTDDSVCVTSDFPSVLLQSP